MVCVCICVFGMRVSEGLMFLFFVRYMFKVKKGQNKFLFTTPKGTSSGKIKKGKLFPFSLPTLLMLSVCCCI